jgi:hypothetical protein
MTRPPSSSALTTPHPLLKPGESITGTLERLAAENDRLRAEKTEMADAILQIGGLSEAHFRTLVSFEIAEFIFTERIAALEPKP